MNKQAYEKCMTAILHKEAGWLGDALNSIKNYGRDVWNGSRLLLGYPSKEQQAIEDPTPSAQMIDMWNNAAENQPEGRYMDINGNPLSVTQSALLKKQRQLFRSRSKAYEDYVNKLMAGDTTAEEPHWND